jgi:hypothetical protein
MSKLKAGAGITSVLSINGCGLVILDFLVQLLPEDPVLYIS